MESTRSVGSSSCQMPPSRRAEVKCPSEIFKQFGDAAFTLRTIPKFRVFWQDFVPKAATVGSHYAAGVVPVSTSGCFLKNGFMASGIPFITTLLLAALFFTFIFCGCFTAGTDATDIYANVTSLCGGCRTGCGNDINSGMYNELPGFVEVMRGICAGQSFADFFEFYAEVFNVNNCGRNYIYRAFLVGLDFETGVGIYRIESCDPFNKCLPVVKKQKYLMFGNSKCYTPGNMVHTIADTQCNGSRSYSSGRVVDNANLSRQGDVNYETITTDMAIGAGAEGAPILNDCGYIVGIVTGITEHGYAIGVTSSFIGRVVDAIIEAACHVQDGPNCGQCYEHALYVDLFGCICYRYGTINWSFRGKTAIDLNQMFLQRSTFEAAGAPCCAPVVAPTALSAHPFIAGCNPCNDWEGLSNRFYNDETCAINRELLGIIIDAEPCGQLAEVVEECNRSAPNWGVGCNQYFQIEKGDLVTHIGKAPLGTLPHQNTPLNILYSMMPCDCVELQFQKANEMYTQCHSLRVRLDDSLCWIGDFKPIITDALQTLQTMERLDIACLGACITDVNSGPARLSCLPADLMCFVQSWLRFIFWLLHAVPQVYRASFFTNLSAFVTALNVTYEDTTLKTAVQPGGTSPSGTITSVATGLVLSNISRYIVTVMAQPSIASCYRPASFIDFISSFQHPNNFESFWQTVPDYFDLTTVSAPNLTTALNAAALATGNSTLIANLANIQRVNNGFCGPSGCSGTSGSQYCHNCSPCI